MTIFGSRKPAVMIVDDDSALLMALEARCRGLGLAAQTFTDMSRAMVQALDSPPALMILDINMRTGNGLSACEALAASDWGRRIPVIIITGDADDCTRRRTQLAGAMYVRKGWRLWERIEPHLRMALGLAVVPERSAPSHGGAERTSAASTHAGE